MIFGSRSPLAARSGRWRRLSVKADRAPLCRDPGLCVRPPRTLAARGQASPKAIYIKKDIPKAVRPGRRTALAGIIRVTEGEPGRTASCPEDRHSARHVLTFE